MKTVLVTSCILLLNSATIAAAATQTLVFGDSLSDPGAEQVATEAAGGTFPEVFPNGQFTDGDVWATKIGSTLSSGYNFAFGAARAVENGDAAPDFAAQRASWFSSGADLAQVSEVAIWFGGNDFRDLLSAGIPTPAGVTTASTAIIGEIIVGIDELSSQGLSDFVVFGMPDLSRIPNIVNEPYAADVRAAVESYDGALVAALQEYADAKGVNINFIDVLGLTDSVFGNASALGFTDLTGYCLADLAACAEGKFFFYDDLHPTSEVHDLIAAAFAEAVAGEGGSGISSVPLPAGFPLLMAGLVAFGLTSRRHKSHA